MNGAAKSREQQREKSNLLYANGDGFNYFDPDPMFVMTYDFNNNPLSYFGGDSWDYSAYALNPKTNSILWFKKNTDPTSPIWDQLTLEHKRLLAAFQFSTFSPWYDTPSARLMLSTHSALARAKNLCLKSGYDLITALADKEKLKEIAENLHPCYRGTLKNLLKKLVGASEENFGVHFNIGATLPLLSKTGSESFQHPIIPSRILFEKLLSYQEVVDDYLKFEEPIRRVNELSLLCHSYLAGNDWDYQVPNGVKKHATRFQRVAIEYGLLELIKKYPIFSVSQLCNFLGQVQYCAMMLILAYTGMRRSEALSLKYDCLTVKKRLYGRIRHLMGVTTKLTRSRFKTSWVTCKQVTPAVQAAQSVCKLAARALYVDEVEINDLPLFLSRIYISFSAMNSRADKRPVGDYRIATLDPIYFDSNMRKVLIEENDLAELKEVAPFQDWDLDGRYVVGQNWPMTLHQLRRSLAVYAAKSGLVRHSSLRRQLKHLSVEMSLYYARGSSRVKSIFNPSRDHIMHDFTTAKLAELDSILYIRDVLTRHEQVRGGHVKVLKAQGFGTDVTVTLDDKKKTCEDFKKGKKAWRSTITGGCTSLNGCEMVAHPTVTRCISGAGCADGVILPEKVEAAMALQQRLIDVIDVTTIEYRSEVEQLNDLKRVYSEIMS